MIINHKGQKYEFPEDATFEEIKSSLGEESSSPLMSQEKISPAMETFNQAVGMGRTPISNLLDIAGGALRGGQNIAATLGEAGQAIGSLANPLQKYIPESMKIFPKVDIREELGLGKDRPVDPREYIHGKYPNPLSQAVGQYAPGAISGGANLPGQVISNALYGATQAQPEEQNLFGLLPYGRIGAAIEGGAMGALPFGIAKAFQGSKNLLNYFRPEKTANAFMESQGAGLPTSTQNIEELGNRMKFAKESAEQEALIPKEKLFETESKSRVIPSQKNPKKIINDVGNIVMEPGQNFSSNQKNEVSKAIKEYYSGNYKNTENIIEPGNLDALVEKIEDSLGHKGLSENQISNIEKSLEMEPLKRGSYLSGKEVDKGYKGLGLDEVHEAYRKKPILENADTLRSGMLRESRRLNEKISSGNYNESDRIRLRRLNNNIKNLTNDMESFYQTLPPEKQKLYYDFRQKWAENVPKYSESGKTIEELVKGGKGLNREEVVSAFKAPTEEIEKILEDIGPSGKQNILYNYLSDIKPRDARALAERLIQGRQSGGYEQLISPEHIDLANEILKRLRHRRIAGITAGGGALIGAEEYLRHKLF